MSEVDHGRDQGANGVSQKGAGGGCGSRNDQVLPADSEALAD